MTIQNPTLILKALRDSIAQSKANIDITGDLMSEQTTIDFPNYRELSKPFQDADTANREMNEFLNGLAELRKKHGMTDILCVVSFNVMYESGEGTAIAHHTFGDPLKAESLAAYACGQESAQRRELINRMLSGKGAKLLKSD